MKSITIGNKEFKLSSIYSFYNRALSSFGQKEKEIFTKLLRTEKVLFYKGKEFPSNLDGLKNAFDCAYGKCTSLEIKSNYHDWQLNYVKIKGHNLSSLKKQKQVQMQGEYPTICFDGDLYALVDGGYYHFMNASNEFKDEGTKKDCPKLTTQAKNWVYNYYVPKGKVKVLKCELS